MAKEKKARRPRGRQTRITKEQLEYLSSHQPQWDEARLASEKSAMSTFYNTITTTFIEKFPDVDLSTESHPQASKRPGTFVLYVNADSTTHPQNSAVADPVLSVSTPATAIPAPAVPTPAAANPTTTATEGHPTTPTGPIPIDPALLSPPGPSAHAASGPLNDLASLSRVSNSLDAKANQWSTVRHVCVYS